MKQKYTKKQIKLMDTMGKVALKALNAGVKKEQARIRKEFPGLIERIDKVMGI